MIRVAAALLLAAAPAAAQEPPWSVPASPAIERTPFVFERAGARLAGTLVRPAGRAPTGAVIVLHGAQAGRAAMPLYRHLADMLPPLGVAVLIYDRRGEGASGGAKGTQDFETLTADALAAYAALARDPRIDAKRIGFWGLSQGGWLALRAAAQEPRATFAIAASAPIVTPDVQMNYAVANVLRVKGYDQAVIDRAVAARSAVDDYARGRATRAAAARAEAGIAREPWYPLTYLKGNIDDPAWPKMIASRPLDALDRSRVPTLLLYGSADPWVPVATSLAELKRTAARHPQVELKVIAGADHAMMLGVPAADQLDPAKAPNGAPDAPAYFAAVADFLARKGITQK